MVLFFAKGEAQSDKFVKYCYSYYRDIMSGCGNDLPQNVEIIREEGKKPRFDTEKAYFNLSHSHGVIMLGISHTPIGVDIEKIRDIDFSKFTFIDAEDVEDFFEKWTERESYLKLTGEGLSNFRCEIPREAHFEHFPVYEDYHACVCADEQSVIAYEMDLSQMDEQ
ncbi:MAG: 4'-phosphopantetheinyl transferase family protein [Christensenellales bacterium]